MKYLVPEAVTPALRTYVRTFLAPDVHTNDNGTNRYQVYTLYLDGPSLTLCRQTQQGLRNRYKLRVRWYDPAPEAPAFIEIKQRTNDFIHKLRAQVTKAEMQQIVHGGYLSLTEQNRDHSIADVIGEFCERRDRLMASEIVLVSYTREAYESSLGNHIRVTFDREIWGRACRNDHEPLSPERHREVSNGQVVMEIKFTKEMPGWIHDFIQSFQLTRVSFPKYVACVENLGLLATPQTTRI